MEKERFLFVMILLVGFSAIAEAQPNYKSKGLGIRWGFWNMGNRSELIRYLDTDETETLETAGVGGWLYFVSRSGDYWSFEFSLGGFAQAKGENLDQVEGWVDATVVIPALLGVRRELLSVDNSSALRPYIALGGGPYWITDVKEHNPWDDHAEEVVSFLKGGAYFGGGMDFFLFDSFGINFDIKYHAVNLDFNHDISGLEVGLGCSIMWGRYTRPTRPDRR